MTLLILLPIDFFGLSQTTLLFSSANVAKVATETPEIIEVDETDSIFALRARLEPKRSSMKIENDKNCMWKNLKARHVLETLRFAEFRNLFKCIYKWFL